jgi:DNA-cytosine methyltransferase
MRHGSLFSGIGGMDLGLERAGFETAWQVERDPFCRRVLAKNFPKAKRYSDVRNIGGHNLEKVDVISFGWPCQDHSTSGKMRGLHGTRSRLFWQAARILRELRPVWALAENVSVALDHDGDEILARMEAAGYACFPLCIPADVVGATHERSRAWLLGVRADSDALRKPGKGVLGNGDTVRALAEAVERWRARADLLASLPRAVRTDAYARVRRECHGLPHWVDRCGALGNALCPPIATLFGCFIREWEAR